LAIPVRKRSPLQGFNAAPAADAVQGMALYGSEGRKYLNTAERRRFLRAARSASAKTRLFCQVLAWSGCRISEALALTPAKIDLDNGAIQFETLKRRRAGIMRQVPVPPSLLQGMDRFFGLRRRQRDPQGGSERLWGWSRSTAWRRVKKVMSAAGITGSAAMPKGLRHSFGVASFLAVPPHLVQRWLGHASLRTTAIYGEVMGPEEIAFAKRVWKTW
jgi:integrase/recombinase XerD